MGHPLHGQCMGQLQQRCVYPCRYPDGPSGRHIERSVYGSELTPASTVQHSEHGDTEERDCQHGLLDTAGATADPGSQIFTSGTCPGARVDQAQVTLTCWDVAKPLSFWPAALLWPMCVKHAPQRRRQVWCSPRMHPCHTAGTWLPVCGHLHSCQHHRCQRQHHVRLPVGCATLTWVQWHILPIQAQWETHDAHATVLCIQARHSVSPQVLASPYVLAATPARTHCQLSGDTPPQCSPYVVPHAYSHNIACTGLYWTALHPRERVLSVLHCTMHFVHGAESISPACHNGTGFPLPAQSLRWWPTPALACTTASLRPATCLACQPQCRSR